MEYNYGKGTMIGLALAFIFLPLIFICLRVWAKWLSAKRLAWDDYLTIAAFIFSMTCCSLQLATAYHGHLGQHQPVRPDGSAIMDDPGLKFFEQTKYALNMISIIGLGLIKSSILVLYRNIFNVRKFRIMINIMLAYVIGWTISFFFSHLFTCYPITVFIDFVKPGEPGSPKCVQQVAMFIAVLITDVIADFVILVLPIPMVLGVQLALRQKLAVMGMLMLGAAVCAVSVTRVVATYSIAEEYTKHPNDVIYYTAPVFFWTNIELSLAVVCACLPTLRPIWLHFYPSQPKTQTGSGYGYGYGSSRPIGTKDSSLAGKYGDLARTPYEEIEEFELTRHEQPLSTSPENGIVKEVTIHQTNA